MIYWPPGRRHHQIAYDSGKFYLSIRQYSSFLAFGKIKKINPKSLLSEKNNGFSLRQGAERNLEHLLLSPLQKVIFATKSQKHKSITKIDMLILSVLRDLVLWFLVAFFMF